MGNGVNVDLARAKSDLRRSRSLIYLLSVLFVLSFSAILQTVCRIGDRDALFFLSLSLSVVLPLFMIPIARALRKRESFVSSENYLPEARVYFTDRGDAYAKRLLNAIPLFFVTLTLFELSEWSFLFLGRSKWAELTGRLFVNQLLVTIPLSILLKDRLCLKAVQMRVGFPPRGKMRAHVIGMLLYSVVFWLAATVLAFLLRRRIAYPLNTFLIATIIFYLPIFAYNLTVRRRITHRSIALNLRRVTAAMLLVAFVACVAIMGRERWYTQSYINAVPVLSHARLPISYDEKSGVYTITFEGEEFRILHLTDIHLGGSLLSRRKDILALEACYAEIAHTRPDLVIVTGDLCFPLGVMSMSFNNSAPVQQFAAFMRNVGVPWAFTYGNHDTESLASMGQEELDAVFRSLSYRTSGTLLYPYTQPKITGRNNQLIEIRDANGTLNTALFLLDSNAYTGQGMNDYDYIHDDQVEWYASEVRRLEKEVGGSVSSLAFFHIPLIEYKEAYELYLSGSSEVTYFFGENNEKMIDKVCCSDHPSKLFDVMVELGSTTGAFCGHDHYNNISLGYKGIRLTYGMSIDYLAMPGIAEDTAQRGAELITLYPDASWDVKQIPLASITG